MHSLIASRLITQSHRASPIHWWVNYRAAKIDPAAPSSAAMQVALKDKLENAGDAVPFQSEEIQVRA